MQLPLTYTRTRVSVYVARRPDELRATMVRLASLDGLVRKDTEV